MGNSRSKTAMKIGRKKRPVESEDEEDINPDCLFPDWGNKINNEYNFVKELGRGGFGMVWKVRRKEDQEEVACKVLNKAKMKQSTLKATRDEVLYYQALDHPNIISFYGGFETRRKLYILQELMLGEIDAEIGNLKESEIQQVIAQVVCALAYAHSKGVIHSDLKPENIMISNKETLHIKLIDFGLSKSRKRWQWMSKVGGTPAYIAPECLSRRYTEAVDMWAVGIITFELFFGYVPFQKVRGNAIKTISNSLKGFCAEVRPGRGNWFPAGHPIHEDAMTFISYLLRINPAERLTASEAQNHPWMTSDLSDDPSESNSLSFILDSLLQKRNLNKAQQFLRQVVGLSAMKKMHPFLTRDLDALFKKCDTDKLGYITWDKFQEAVEALLRKNEDIEMTVEDVEAFMMSIDTSKSGKIWYEDLISWLTFRHLSKQDDRVWDAVMALDIDGNGMVDTQDLDHLMQKPDMQRKVSLDTIVAVKDMVSNAEGGVGYLEFIQLMEDNHSPSRPTHSNTPTR